MKKVLLIILDGFGEAPPSAGNAVAAARMPFFQSLRAKYPTTLLKTDGHASGLPEGQTGASEPGHITIGAGRVVFQPLEEINQAFATGAIRENKEFAKFLAQAKQGKRVHLLGMVSDGGVHSHIAHLNALTEIFAQEGIKDLYLHAIADGRDVPERSVKTYLEQVKGVKIASLIGRYYALDRDRNFDRVQKAYNLLTRGEGEKITEISDKIYAHAETDYYLPAFVLPDFAPIAPDDLVLFFNFRSDRAQELTEAFTKPDFAEFPRDFRFQSGFLAFGPYTLDNAPNAFPPLAVRNNLGSIWAKNGLKQLRIAETEKFAHVTFFFNSQEKEPYAGEERILIPSPKCESYAEKPEMSAEAVTDALVTELQKERFDAIVLNFANADLVGHSGVFGAAVAACEFLDRCLARIVPLALEKGFQMIITADHGNSDEMLYPDGSVCPAHSKNPVPCVFITDKKVILHEHGELCDIAPTLLAMQGLEIPTEMTGKSFVE